MSKKILYVICVLSGCLLLSSPLMAGDDGVLPSDIFTAIMLKALNYDRNIDRQSQEKVTIGIVCFTDDEEAKGFVRQVQADIAKVQTDFRLKDKPVEGKVLFLKRGFDKAKLETELKQDKISVLVLAAHDAGANRTIFETTRELRINSICYNSECVREGAGLGIILRDNRPRMLINLAATQQEGSDYGGKFLALCEVLK